MKFATNWDRPERVQETFTNTEQAVYKQTIDKSTGERKLVVKEKINIYDKIQEFAEECNIMNILRKHGVDLLKQGFADNEAQIIDLTNVPENLLETMTIIDNAKYIWDRQSLELKQKFDNDFKKFIASSENGQLAKMLNERLKTDPSKFTQITEEQRAQMVKPAQIPQNYNSIGEIIPEGSKVAGNGQISQNIDMLGGNK